MASDQASSGAASRVASRTDPGWKYCFPVQEGDTNTVVCSFCSKEMRGGITRAKQHLMAKKGNVAPCTKCPKEVREELWALLKEKEKGDSSGPPSDRVDVDDILYVESEDEVAVTPSSAARKKNAAKKGPLDLYCNAANAKRRREKMRQKDIQECCDKKAILRVHQKIARWWYQAGLSFNCIKLESFQEMLTEVGAYGPNIVAPTYHAIRVPLLNMEMEYTNELLKNHEEQWSKHGCSIMSDAWTDRKQRCIINFLVSSSAGTKFVKSIDGSNFVKTGEKLFELLDSLVEEIGEEKVVQIITDNGSNYVLAGKMLEEKRKHLYWTPCAAHCLDLMLEDIGKIPSIKKTIQRAISLVGFIYSHSSTLSLLRQFTNKRELVRHAVTRFATSFLSLERLYGEKSNLRKMFTSDEWNNNKLSKESKGKEASKVVLMPSFWNHVVFTLKVMAPLVRVLRLVDGEKKPAMGYIYEAMDKAKETIMKSFNNIESKYKDIFAIIDERWNCQLHRPLHAAGHFLNPEFFYANTDLEFDLEVTNGLYDCISRLVTSRDVQHKILDELPIYKSASGLFGGDFAISQRKTIAPAQWWRMYGHSAPNLQKLAIKILSLTCSASGCERNWSVFEQIHTKKRNRLDHKKLHDLVYVKYNQQLHHRRSLRDEIDPITLNDIDECNEWLVGEMDDTNEDAGNELVFDDDQTLNWATVYEASGVGEPITHTRQQTRKRKETSSSGVAAAAKVSKKGPGPTSTSRGKKIVVDQNEELEFEDDSEASEEAEELVSFEKSDGEEEEGYAPIDDKENDYVGVEEED